MPLFQDKDGNIAFYTEEEKEELKREGLGIDGNGGHWLVIDDSKERAGLRKSENILKFDDSNKHPHIPAGIGGGGGYYSGFSGDFNDPEDEEDIPLVDRKWDKFWDSKPEEKAPDYSSVGTNGIPAEDIAWGNALTQYEQYSSIYDNSMPDPYLEDNYDPVEEWRQQNEELLMWEREGFIDFDKW